MFKDRFTVTELRDLLGRYGVAPRDVLSVRSRPYKALGLANRNLPGDELLVLLSEHPALIRRPLVAADDALVIGFDRDALARLAGHS